MFWWVQLSQLLSCIAVQTIFSFPYNLCSFIGYIYWPIFYGFYNYCTKIRLNDWSRFAPLIRLNIIDIHISLMLEEQIYKTVVKLSTKKNVYDVFHLPRPLFALLALQKIQLSRLISIGWKLCKKSVVRSISPYQIV